LVPKDLKNSKQKIPTTECIRCGTCCQKGGPSFHLEDKALVEKGVILAKHLYTIRAGELSYDNIQRHLIPATTDIIKIKGQKDSWTCFFLNIEKNQCRIYDHRPLECRALKCWDTREIEKIYAANRLTRQDLLSGIEGLWDLIKDHQARCSYEQLKRFVDALEGAAKDAALQGLLKIIAYDSEMRKLAVQKGSLDPEMTDFLFGRPFTETLKGYGFKVTKKEGAYRLVPVKIT
jgi:Fe-S-cluster containining protein